MAYAKNTVAILIWTVFAVLISVTYTFSVFDYTQSLGLDLSETYVLGIVLMAIISLLLCGVKHLIDRNNISLKLGERKIKYLECILVVGLLLGGVVIRFLVWERGHLAVYEEDYYFYQSLVTKENLGQASSIYVSMQQGIFRILGNRYEIGIFFQSFLYVFSSFLCYIGIKRVIGFIGALATLALLLFIPKGQLLSLQYNPNILAYLLLAVFTFIIATSYVVLKRNKVKLRVITGMFLLLGMVSLGILLGNSTLEFSILNNANLGLAILALALCPLCKRKKELISIMFFMECLVLASFGDFLVRIDIDFLIQILLCFMLGLILAEFLPYENPTLEPVLEVEEERSLIYIPKNMEIKKRVSKQKIDYNFDIPEEKMCFDHEIGDETDFPIQE